MKTYLEFPKLFKILTAALVLISITTVMVCAGLNEGVKYNLQFKKDGTFKIVQFTDVQDGPDIDQRTLRLMNKVLDFEKPDLVVLTGDMLDGRCKSVKDIKKAIDNVAQPMEKRKISWAVVFGNHDSEQKAMTKEEMLKAYMSYPHDLSRRGPENIDGVGNYNLLIADSKGKKPVFNIYMLDSGTYATGRVGGYDWIKQSQINWYRENSTSLKKANGKVVPALMFFHIPLPEFKTAWSKGDTTGARNKAECSPIINSGLFASVMEMGDVEGIFVGHDHTNDYVANYFGVKLGYSRNVGYGTYGKKGFSRGARVFLLHESDTSCFETWMRLDSDFNNP
ncbi:MAG: metallophosphoesterase family protein [Bacillota bacterium]|nr:metallophosphoesterase family protein [Bacillota bacterium]